MIAYVLQQKNMVVIYCDDFMTYDLEKKKKNVNILMYTVN